MLCHIGCRAAILAAKREALQQTEADQDDRGGDADRGRARQQAHDEGRETHDQDGDEEGILAADEIADAAEHQGAKGTHDEAGGEGEQREDVAGVFVKLAEELRADDGGERAVKIEIIPFEYCAE